MPFNFGATPDRTTALELVYGAFEDIKAEFYDVKYGEHHWRDVVPEASVDTSINPGATSTSYRVRDWRGRGTWRGRHDQGVPTVGRTMDKNLINIEVAGVAALFDREDARQVSMGYDESILTDLPRYMRMACDNHVEGTIFYGDANVNFLGWLSYTGVTVIAAAVTGTQNSPSPSPNSQWAHKTSDQIVFDINNAINTVWVNSKLVHLPDTVYLPPTQYSLISSLRMSDASDKTVMEYLRRATVYTAVTGQELTIKPIRYLDQAGASNVDRMVVQETKRENMKVPFPLPFDLLEPQEWGFDVNLFAEYKFGSYHMPYPNSMAYVDGI